MPDFAEHEDRAAVLSELHVRPFLQFTTPHRFEHFAFVIDPRAAGQERAQFAELCARLGAEPPQADARFHRIAAGAWTLRWELHSEFVSYTWSTSQASRTGFDLIGEALPDSFSSYRPAGKLLARIEVALIPRLDNPDDIERAFSRTSLAVIDAADGGARLATDFKADAAGVVRYLIEDLGLTPTRAGRLVQRVLEMETYRTLALLGLPVARRAEPVVRHVEEELLRLSRAMGAMRSAAANRQLLQELTALSAELETEIASTSFRFGATRAYADLVSSRIKVIRESEHKSYVSFSRFLARRFSPAIATCAAIERRQQALSERLANAVDLLRTRIQSELEDQNRLLLASMNRRSRMQLRLQQTVEGLSIAAVTYYIVGLVGYLAKAVDDAGALPGRLTPGVVAGLSVPFVVIAVWWLLQRARRAWARRGWEEDLPRRPASRAATQPAPSPDEAVVPGAPRKSGGTAWPMTSPASSDA
jgi:uncharacterized membrane-anchored protein